MATLSKIVFKPSANGSLSYTIGAGKVLLSADISQALSHLAINREALTDSGLQFIRREVNNDTYYYLVNHTAKDIDTQIPVNTDGKAIILDPQSGLIGSAAMQGKNVRVQIRSGEALFLNMSKNQPENISWQYLNKSGQPIAITQPWLLHFTAGGPELPSDQKLNQLVSWTKLNDPKLDVFSGTGVYTTEFNLKSKTAKEYVLNLNQVEESARVWINGQEVGILWSIPFQARIGKYLKQGNNTIKIEVVNLMANRIRDMDIKKIEWRKYHEINFVNINYKDFDASKWSVMPSGLIGPVVITPYF